MTRPEHAPSDPTAEGPSRPGVLRHVLLAVVIAGVLIAAACADDDEVSVGGDDEATPTAEPTPEPSMEPSPTAEPTPEPTGAPTVDEAALADLAEARERWDENGLDTYSYTWSRFCECLPEYQGPFTVAVTGGEVTGMTTFGQPAPDDVARRTVEDMFTEIAAAIATGVRVDVAYDAADGHPTAVSLDLDAIAVDGGVSYAVDSFFGTGDVAERIAEARARWDATGVDSYELVYREVCFCPEIVVTVSVRDGAVVDSSVDSSVDSEIDGAIDVEIRTVEDLFDELEAALALPPAGMTVEFDPDLGHPVSYFVDEELNMADEEFGVTVESLTPAT